MRKGYMIAAGVAVALVGGVMTSRAYYAHKAVDPVSISDRKIAQCFKVTKHLMKSPSETVMVSGHDQQGVVLLAVDAPNAFGVKLRADVLCDMKPSPDPTLAGYWSVEGVSVDGKKADDYAFAMASSDALLEKD
jgi:hypothetical protein